MKRNLDGNVLALEKVSVCHCVQVTGLNRESTTEDAVRYHFENPKNGGGDVHNVETHYNARLGTGSLRGPSRYTT